VSKLATILYIYLVCKKESKKLEQLEMIAAIEMY